MISHEELKEIAKMRLSDAQVLHKKGNHDGALYLCGYAIELGLKAVITKNFNSSGKLSTSHIPSTKEEFKIVSTITNHDLDAILALVPSNIIQQIKTKYLTEWSLIQKWNPEMRYALIRGQAAKKEAGDVIQAVSRILRYLSRLP
jgi:HEPN domain-containing protein